jgi:hypothetical protein
MITEIGKNIIGKYLIGQAPAYASYIAIGCGETPLNTGDVFGNYSAKENLTFEMFRIPVSSRGFVNEDGINKIVLTGELPTEERYEITEIGLYSAGANPSAGANDSKTVFSFSSTENWQYHSQSSTIQIPTITAALDAPLYNNVIATANNVFQTNSDNPIFFKTARASRYESCRFLNNTILIAGDDSELTLDESSGPSEDHFVIEPGSNHIHLTGVNVDFAKNSPLDELRLAFSLINKNGDSVTIPDTIRVLVDFAATDDGSGEYARFEAEINHGTSGNPELVQDFETNRYFIVKKQLQDLYTTANFTWDAVTVVKIYASVLVENSGPNLVPSGNFYIALDAMRLENIGTLNPLYGLTGYSVIKNSDAETIVKLPNTTNYIEFRFSLDVT